MRSNHNGAYVVLCHARCCVCIYVACMLCLVLSARAISVDPRRFRECVNWFNAIRSKRHRRYTDTPSDTDYTRVRTRVVNIEAYARTRHVCTNILLPTRIIVPGPQHYFLCGNLRAGSIS